MKRPPDPQRPKTIAAMLNVVNNFITVVDVGHNVPGAVHDDLTALAEFYEEHPDFDLVAYIECFEEGPTDGRNESD